MSRAMDWGRGGEEEERGEESLERVGEGQWESCIQLMIRRDERSEAGTDTN